MDAARNHLEEISTVLVLRTFSSLASLILTGTPFDTNDRNFDNYNMRSIMGYIVEVIV